MKVLTKEEIKDLVKVGTPVQVILSKTADNVIHYLGEGIMLVGDYSPEVDDVLGIRPQPCIYLPKHDKIVWGFQVWFSEEMEMKGEIVDVAIPDEFEDYNVIKLEESDIIEQHKRLSKTLAFANTLTDVAESMLKGEDTTEQEKAVVDMVKTLIIDLTKEIC